MTNNQTQVEFYYIYEWVDISELSSFISFLSKYYIRTLKTILLMFFVHHMQVQDNR